MKKRIILLFIAVFAILNINAISSDEKVKLELNLKKGQVLNQTVKIDIKMTISKDAEDFTGFMKMGIVSNNEIKEVNGDSYKTEFSLERILLKFETPQDTNVKINFDSNVPSDPQVDEIMNKILELKLDLKLMKDGSVKEMNGLSDFFNGFIDDMYPGDEATKAEMKSQTGQYLNDELINKQLAAAQSFSFPDHDVALGESWVIENSVEGVNQKYTITVKEITAEKVELKVNGSIDATTDVNDSKMNLKGTFEMYSSVDQKSGVVLNSDGKINFDFSVSDKNQNTTGKITGDFIAINVIN